MLHDNAYSELVFDGKSCGSFLRFPGAREVGVEFNSLSKTYGLAGARVGFCIGNREVVGRLKTLKSNMDYGLFLPIQKAAAAAVTGDQSCVAVTRAAYENGVICSVKGWRRSDGRLINRKQQCLSGLKYPDILIPLSNS